MGIYIKNMKMPTSCATCELFGEYGCPLIGTVTYALTRGKRHKDCPLIFVPPHGRLGDLDALCKTLRRMADNEYTPTVFANWIENHIDSIIEVEED